MLQENDIVPNFKLPATDGKVFELAALEKQTLILYFYPKDATPGCTTEAEQFRDLAEEFRRNNCLIAGISRDSIASHEKFKARYNLPFDLLSDTEETVCTLFSVIRMKNMYGKQVRGIERSTFIIRPDRTLAHAYRNVKAPGHAAEILRIIQSSD
ncbi:MAG: peroxiredoxin [Proteobacteria bacterium]|nr:peroxiredoxin [Pseudomonadota bacterium]MDE3208382.1 peroxiredoxin [Pseudomonadota bacterium]